MFLHSPIVIRHFIRPASRNAQPVTRNAKFSSHRLFQQFLYFSQRSGIDHILRFQPTPPGLAHPVAQMIETVHAVGQARRGWLEKQDVINTRSLAEVKKLLKKTMG